MKNKNYWVEKNCEGCGKLFWSLIKRKGRFCSNRCSTLSTAKDISRLEKIKETKLFRYGSETFVNPAKAKLTCLKKYGVNNASQSQEVINKIRQTNIERYGVEWTWQSDETKNKISSTIQTRFGVKNISHSEEIKKKKVENSQERYGTNNPSQSKEVIAKIIQTNLSKYGHRCPLKNQIIKDKATEAVRITYYKNLKERLKDRVDFLFDEIAYITTDKSNKYSFQCKKCHGVFKDHVDGGRIPRCMDCYPYLNGVSQGELEINEYVKSLLPDILIKTKCWEVLGNQEIDIYIPALKIAIEYHGLYWHSEIGGNKSPSYHLDKYRKCKQQNIRLIQIFEDEWELNQAIVRNRLKSIFGKNGGTSLYGRNCEIKEIPGDLAASFIIKHHIQGNVPAKIYIGLFSDQELVSVMSLGKLRIALGSKHEGDFYEILRLVSSKSVVGGASKMFQYFIKTYRPKDITSFCDLRWNTGIVYEKMGMTLNHQTPPNYWYFKPGYSNRYHRFGFRKNVLSKRLASFDPLLTEWQNMQLNGYDRIWDCGSNKYAWKNPMICELK